MVRGDGPFKVIERVGDNAYKLQLPRDMAVSVTFNIGDLSPYVEDCFEEASNLRSNPQEEREVDAEQGMQESFHNSKTLNHVYLFN